MASATDTNVDQPANHLAPCPDSPNCVSSLDPDSKHRVAPLRYSGSRVVARAHLLAVLNQFDRMRIVVDDPDYIRAEFRSRLFRFVDIVEFHFPAQENLIHLKSASQVGYADLGVNRRRVAQIRKRFEEPPP